MSGHAHCSQSITAKLFKKLRYYLFTRCLKPWFFIMLLQNMLHRHPEFNGTGVSRKLQGLQSPVTLLNTWWESREAPGGRVLPSSSWDNPSHLHRRPAKGREGERRWAWWGWEGGRAVVSTANQNQSSQIQSFSLVTCKSQLSLYQLIPKARRLGDLKTQPAHLEAGNNSSCRWDV